MQRILCCFSSKVCFFQYKKEPTHPIMICGTGNACKGTEWNKDATRAERESLLTFSTTSWSLLLSHLPQCTELTRPLLYLQPAHHSQLQTNDSMRSELVARLLRPFPHFLVISNPPTPPSELLLLSFLGYDPLAP